MAKLTVPLAYNFLTFLSPEIYQTTSFYHFLGRLINLTPLGKGFSDLLPILILLPVCATLFGLYNRIARVVGLSGSDVIDDAENPSGTRMSDWRDGRDLIERDLNNTSTSLTHLASGRRSPPRVGTSPLQPSSISNHRAHPAESRPTEPRPGSSSPRLDQDGRRERERERMRGRREEGEQEQEGEENALSEFVHRVRNTFEVAEPLAGCGRLGRHFETLVQNGCLLMEMITTTIMMILMMAFLRVVVVVVVEVVEVEIPTKVLADLVLLLVL